MMQVFCPSLVVDEDVIQIYHYKIIGERLQESSIILMKFVWAFIKPKGMTNHLKRPYLELKAIFHTIVFSIGN
jgi:hypothetical protein